MPARSWRRFLPEYRQRPKGSALQGVRHPVFLWPQTSQGTIRVSLGVIPKMSVSATRQSIEHWSQTPLYYSPEERYSKYPWLYEAAEFRAHRGERVLEIGCGTGCDLLQFAKHGAFAVGIDVTPAHLELATQRVGQMATIVRADATALPFPEKS